MTSPTQDRDRYNDGGDDEVPQVVGVAVPGQPAQHPALPGPGAAEAGEIEAPGVAVDNVVSVDSVATVDSDSIHPPERPLLLCAAGHGVRSAEAGELQRLGAGDQVAAGAGQHMLTASSAQPS